MWHHPLEINRVRQYALVYVKKSSRATPYTQLFHVFLAGRSRYARGAAHALAEPPRMTERPAYMAVSPSCSSMRMSWLYLASRSERESDPVLI